MKTQLTLIIPPLISFNEYQNKNRGTRAGYRMGSKAKKAMDERVVKACIEQLGRDMQIMEEFYPLHVHFDWFVANKRKDADNIRFSAKFILDGFQKYGLIKNDNLTCIAKLSDDYFIDKENPRVEVTIFKCGRLRKAGSDVRS